MSHDHSHGHSRSEFYTEQLFTIGVCGALGLVAVSLYATGKLYLMLNVKFHPWVLAGGIGLLAMVIVRAIVVWNSIEEPDSVPTNGHDHGDHDHDHADCGHDHHHHEHAHGHHDHVEHEHAHSHDHGEVHVHTHAHDHGWAPWRYVVLLLPVVLFLLKLPNDGFSAYHGKQHDLKGLKFDETAQESGVLPNFKFKELERIARSADMRALYEGKRVSLIGRFYGSEAKRFTLSRFKINCCAADAIPMNAVILIDPDPKIAGIDPVEKQNKWVQVTGLIAFLKGATGEYVTGVLIKPKEGQPIEDFVEEVDAPANPYLN